VVVWWALGVVCGLLSMLGGCCRCWAARILCGGGGCVMGNDDDVVVGVDVDVVVVVG
jgi:hypothetical protein